MSLLYRVAAPAELELLTETRLEVLRAANCLPETADLEEVRAAARAYYARSLAGGTHTALLAFDGETWVGSGGVSFYEVLPTYHNPTGKRAYLMNLYTRPDHRRQGIARRVLALLVEEVRRRGVPYLSLEATDQGRLLYESRGFVPLENEMYLPREGEER